MEKLLRREVTASFIKESIVRETSMVKHHNHVFHVPQRAFFLNKMNVS